MFVKLVRYAASALLFSLDLSIAYAPQLGYALLASGEAERSRLYPENLTARPMLWLWTLRDVAWIGTGLLLSVLALTQTGSMIPLVITAALAFFCIRHGGISMLDFLRYAIVDRLAVLPEVAACYEQWQCVKDELVRFHNQNPREHLPLSQQKEFRVIQNMVIREADRTRETRRDIAFPLPAEEATVAAEIPVQSSPHRPTAGAEQPQDVTPVQDSATLPATLRLLHHMSRIFQHDAQISPVTMRIDSKRRRRLQEKRMALGHKRDDHEEEQRQHQNNHLTI